MILTLSRSLLLIPVYIRSRTSFLCAIASRLSASSKISWSSLNGIPSFTVTEVLMILSSTKLKDTREILYFYLTPLIYKIAPITHPQFDACFSFTYTSFGYGSVRRHVHNPIFSLHYQYNKHLIHS